MHTVYVTVCVLYCTEGHSLTQHPCGLEHEVNGRQSRKHLVYWNAKRTTWPQCYLLVMWHAGRPGQTLDLLLVECTWMHREDVCLYAVNGEIKYTKEIAVLLRPCPRSVCKNFGRNWSKPKWTPWLLGRMLHPAERDLGQRRGLCGLRRRDWRGDSG